MMLPCRSLVSRAAVYSSTLVAHSRCLSSSTGSSGLYKPTTVRRRTYKKQSANEIVDMMGEESATQAGYSPLALNLFEDPTGGLVSGPAEELTMAELESQIQMRLLRYSKETFYLLYSSFVDLIFIIIERNLAPVVQDDEKGEGTRAMATEVTKWFLNGPATVKNPSYTAEAMGAERWQVFSHALVEHWEDAEEVMPLTRVVRKYKLREDMFVPFFRQLAIDLIDNDKRKELTQLLPGLTLSLANGRAPAMLDLPDNQSARAMMVAELFLSCGQETGNTDLAYLGVQLLRANDMPTPFSFQKQLTNVFSAAARIRNDWQMRGTGQLADTYPKWVEYYKRVRLDNAKALKRIDAEAQTKRSPGATTTTDANDVTQALTKPLEQATTTKAKGMHSYFSSKRGEELEYVEALQRNVDNYMLKRRERLLNARAEENDTDFKASTQRKKEVDAVEEQTDGETPKRGRKRKERALKSDKKAEKSNKTSTVTTESATEEMEENEEGEIVFRF